MDLNFGVTSIETQCSTEFRTSLFVGMLQFEDQIIRELDRMLSKYLCRIGISLKWLYDTCAHSC